MWDGKAVVIHVLLLWRHWVLCVAVCCFWMRVEIAVRQRRLFEGSEDELLSVLVVAGKKRWKAGGITTFVY
jgi:hypothetical protein